jgi:tRNA threonylcarbamoyladenosine biosynthesis protein TsaE
MAPTILDCIDEAGTVALGRRLSELLPDGSVVGLIGPLGAGKTRLVQAFCTAEGINPRDVVSPTFVLVHEYQGPRPIYHFDAYRLKDDDEFLALGPDEYFESDGITFVEWADRVALCMPRERLEIRIETTSSSARRFTITGCGPRNAALAATLAASPPAG